MLLYRPKQPQLRRMHRQRQQEQRPRFRASLVSNPVVLGRMWRQLRRFWIHPAVAPAAGVMTAVAVVAGVLAPSTTAVAVDLSPGLAPPHQISAAHHHHADVGQGLSPPAGPGHPHLHLPHPPVGPAQPHLVDEPGQRGKQCISERDHLPQLREQSLLQNGMRGGTIISMDPLARHHSKYPI